MVGKIKSEKKGKKESSSMKKKSHVNIRGCKKEEAYFASLNTTLSILPIHFTTRPTS